MSVARSTLSTEIPVLTGLRGFAAFWVLLYHAWVEAGPRAMIIGNEDYGINLTPAFSGGWTGVDIFFTLSAFLLSLPFVSWQMGLTQRPALGTYWQRRVLRIFPAYYTQIAVLLILAGVFGIGVWPGFGQLLGNLVLWFNIGHSGVEPLNAVTYTLSIEFCFYLLLPVLAFLLHPRSWIVLLLLALVETQIYRHLMFDPAADVPHKVVVLEQLPGRLDQFVFGMLAAYAYGRASVADRLPDARTADLLFVLGIAGIVTMLTLAHLNNETYWQGHWLLFVWHGVVGAAVALMLFAGAAGSRIARELFDNRPLRYLGLISFGVYLWHYPILHWLSSAHAFDRVSGYRLPWMLPIALLLSCLVADVSYRLIERPLLRIGRGRSERPNVTSDQVPAVAGTS
jgi:peptidoglycan/LPS O-acetylase OafA/YrhL